MKFYLGIVGIIFLLLACNRTFKSSEHGLAVTGKVGEIMVVCEPGIWNSEVKLHLDTALTQFIMPYFPDVETFTLAHKTAAQFQQGNKRYRNLLIVEIDPSATKNRIIKELHTYATDQLVVKVIAKDLNELQRLAQSNMEEVHASFEEMEWKRIMRRFNNKKNALISAELKRQFGVDLALPKGSKIVTKRTNFYRIEIPVDAKPIQFLGGQGSEGTGFIQSGIMVYQYDFKDSSQLNLAALLRDRDTMLKYNVPHEIPGLYMGTQYNKLVAPEGNFTTNASKKLKAYEMRGMFKFLGAAKAGTGGAFWSYHFVHHKRGKVICVSGYLDAPSMTKWILHLREIQAILKSIELA